MIQLKTNFFSFDSDWVTIGDASEIDPALQEKIRTELWALKPWKKGPYRCFGIEIDSEWQSFRKWNRLVGYEDRLIRRRRILDVGCNNGYYMFRMLPFSPASILGIDPIERCAGQFNALYRFLDLPQLQFQKLGLADIPRGSQFDSIFLMGILYHQRDPHLALEIVRKHLAPGGDLVLETLILPGELPEVLSPLGRYAAMRNVYTIPSLSELRNWLKVSGFSQHTVVAIDRTHVQEQRSTAWSAPVSLENFLDPQNAALTIEGHPAPIRAMLICS